MKAFFAVALLIVSAGAIAGGDANQKGPGDDDDTTTNNTMTCVYYVKDTADCPFAAAEQCLSVSGVDGANLVCKVIKGPK